MTTRIVRRCLVSKANVLENRRDFHTSNNFSSLSVRFLRFPQDLHVEGFLCPLHAALPRGAYGERSPATGIRPRMGTRSDRSGGTSPSAFRKQACPARSQA